MPTSILIFGGTFDPPHRAHIELPRIVAEKVGCTHILYIPTSANPLKEESPTPIDHRLTMLRLALDGKTNCEISEIEAHNKGPAYTVDTLEKLREIYGEDVQFRLLIGADAVISFPRWKNPERILELAKPVVMLRPPYDQDLFRTKLAETFCEEEAERWLDWTVNCPAIDVDATTLREKLMSSEDCSESIDHNVLGYIKTHRLYGVSTA